MEKKVIVITGATGGIGREMVKHFEQKNLDSQKNISPGRLQNRFLVRNRGVRGQITDNKNRMQFSPAP